MATIQRFEDLVMFKKARELTKVVYASLSSCKDYGFRDQIQRAAVSVMNNIAEGFERGTNAELKRFLFIAKGSSGEIRSLLQLALSLGYISKIKYDEHSPLTTEISRMLSGFIKTLRTL